MKKIYKNIPVEEEVGFEFDQLQLNLRKKHIFRTKSELIKMLINVFKNNGVKE